MTTTIWSGEALTAAWLGANRERRRQHMSRLSRDQVRRLLDGEPLVFNANNPLFYDATVIAAVSAAVALLNSGFMNVYSGTQPANNGSLTGTRLAHLTFSATAFATPTASGGTVTALANSIASDTSAVAGTAGYFALLKSDNSTVVATGSVGAPSGADLNFNSLAISTGATISCSSFTITSLEA